jgi:hypothetical protein
MQRNSKFPITALQSVQLPKEQDELNKPYQSTKKVVQTTQKKTKSRKG